MDASSLYPKGFHPVANNFLPDASDYAPHISRSQALVKYYYIDFGISVQIPPESPSKLVTGRLGRDRDPPELASNNPYDPFKLDVFIIGNLFRTEFLEVSALHVYPESWSITETT